MAALKNAEKTSLPKPVKKVFFNATIPGSKISIKRWSPDYGPRKLVNNAGVTAIGAREFLIAYNVKNL